MGERRLLSLAAGTVLDVSPADAVDVAAAAGWPAVGVWFDPATWTASVTADVARRVAASGVQALDIEPFIFGRGWTHQAQIVDAAAAVGARFLLVASGPAGRGEVIDGLAELCELACANAPGTTVVLEFLPIFTVGTLADAVDVVRTVGAANLAVLIDSLHLARSGAAPEDLAAYDSALFPYLQFADAPARPSTDLRDEALFGRQLPGQGRLPLVELLAALPDVPVSVELRSRQLNEQYPDPVERARAVLHATREFTDITTD